MGSIPGASTRSWPLREALLRQCEVGVALCEADGTLAAINPTLEAMLGTELRPSNPEEWARAFYLYDESGEQPLPPCGDPLARAVRGEKVIDQLVAVRPPGQPTRFLRRKPPASTKAKELLQERSSS